LFETQNARVIANGISFENVTVSDASSYLKITQTSGIVINSLNFQNCSQSDPSDLTNVLINLEEISSTLSNSIAFNTVTVEESTISVLKVSNKDQSKDIVQNVTINDLTVTNNNYSFATSVISTEDITSNEAFNIIFNNVIMTNLYFVSSSQLFSLSHQISEQLEINVATFDNIRFGGIKLKVHNQASSIDTLVLLKNATVSNIDTYLS